jgi:hypothetical protein
MKKYIINIITDYFGLIYLILFSIKDLLNISFYLKCVRILKIIRNDAIKYNGGKYCIYSIYSPNGIQKDHKITIQNLNELKINIVCIYVGKSNDLTTLKYLEENTFITVVRKNIGRDFGAYKDGLLEVLKLQSKFKDLKKLIFLNDSCFIRSNGIQEIFEKLIDDRYDVCAAFENFQYKYHLQSFCLSVSGSIFFNKKFLKFWKNYVPFSSRPHSINSGEKGLTKCIMKITDKIDIIFPLDLLYKKLLQKHEKEQIDFETLLLLPTELRKVILKDYSDQLSTLLLVRAPIEGVIENFNDFKAKMRDYLLTSSLASLNTVHYLGPIYAKYFMCPLIKKDIYFRHVYSSLYEANYVVDEFYKDEVAEDLINYAHQLLRSKNYVGSGAGLFKNILISKGYI